MADVKLSPIQRAFLIGYRRAKAEASKELRELSQEWELQLASLSDEVAGIANRFEQFRAAERAERDPSLPLN